MAKYRKVKEKKKEVHPERRVRDYDHYLKSDGSYAKRLLIFTPSLGMVRMEWATQRMTQTIPCNWSVVSMTEFMHSYVPIEFQLADAQNLMAKHCMDLDFEWVLFWEDDNIPPNDALLKMNEYMVDGKVPVVSGLYFTKSEPAEPILYRGRGNGYFDKWKFRDKVWVDGIPFGFQLMHASLLRAAWKESPEYMVKGIKTRRVFSQPESVYTDETGNVKSTGGTTDLEWCRRIIQDDLFTKAGWPEYAKKRYPFLVDTSIIVKHIDRNNGVQYPIYIPKKYQPEDGYMGKEIID